MNGMGSLEFQQMIDKSSSTDTLTTSHSFRERITQQDLRHLLYDRNPIKVIHIDEMCPEDTNSGTVLNDNQNKEIKSVKSITESEFELKGKRTTVVEQKKSAKKRCQRRYDIESFPNEVQLCVSGIPGAGFGVCAKRHIPVGTWIGPFEGRRVSPERVTSDMDTSYMWEIFRDGKLLCFLDGSDPTKSSWMRFIRCARYKGEQNLFAFQHAGSIYYRAFREIRRGTELLVWYDNNYQQHVGIPVGDWELSAVRCFSGRSTARHSVVADLSLDSESPLIQDASLETVCGESTEPVNTKRRKCSPSPVWGLLCQGPFDSGLGHDYVIIPSSGAQLQGKGCRTQLSDSNSCINRKADLPVTSSANSARPSPSPADSPSHLNCFDEVASKHSADLFKCGQCKQTFTQRSLLNNHLCPHLPSRPYRCGHCPESFAQPKELRAHAVLHISEKPFKCGYCLRSFAGATTLDNHVRTHTGEKPFLCEKCGKAFTQASQLSRHQRICQEHENQI